MIKQLESKHSSYRLVSYLLIALLVTVFLFYFMAFLISGGKKFVKSSDSENLIEFVRMKRPTQTELRKRKVPKKPKIEDQPKATKSLSMKQKSITPKRPNMKFDTPKLDIPLALGAGGIGVASGNGSGGSQSDEMPLVRVEPQFPREAIMKGIDRGWVRSSFDLKADGTVTNVRIVDSSPREIFDMAARRAILKWKYRPKIVDGKTVLRKGLKVQLDFGMENQQ
jgi:protein TonB